MSATYVCCMHVGGNWDNNGTYQPAQDAEREEQENPRLGLRNQDLVLLSLWSQQRRQLTISGLLLEILLRRGQRLRIENLWGAIIQVGVLAYQYKFQVGGGKSPPLSPLLPIVLLLLTFQINR